MNATELFHKDGRTAGVFYCEKCRRVKRTETEANKCCQPYTCSTCGKECRQYWTICDACNEAKTEAVEVERFEKAEKVAEWSGWVYSDGLGFNNGYFDSVEELVNHCEDEAIDLPPYAWTCREMQFVSFDLGSITERFADEAHENWDPDQLKGTVEFEVAIETFITANKDQVSYSPDYKKAVLLKTIQ